MNEEELAQLVSLLKKLEPGFLPIDIFIQIARIVALPVTEFVPLRVGEQGNIEVLLLPRESWDTIWPDMVHTPGTVIRATDADSVPYQPFERIVKEELAGTKVSPPYFVGTHIRKSRRGTEQALVFWVEVMGAPKAGTFFDITKLPSNTVEDQEAFILEAAKKFKQEKSL